MEVSFKWSECLSFSVQSANLSWCRQPCRRHVRYLSALHVAKRREEAVQSAERKKQVHGRTQISMQRGSGGADNVHFLKNWNTRRLGVFVHSGSSCSESGDEISIELVADTIDAGPVVLDVIDSRLELRNSSSWSILGLGNSYSLTGGTRSFSKRSLLSGVNINCIITNVINCSHKSTTFECRLRFPVCTICLKLSIIVWTKTVKSLIWISTDAVFDGAALK